jgi:uncharacterized membrane protein
MLSLALAALFFYAIHGLVSGTGLRGATVARIGENAYRGIFSLASAAGLAWLVYAYGHGDPGYLVIWPEPPGARWATIILMLPILVLGFAGLTIKSPTAVGQEKALADPEPARGVLRITRHPFLSSVAAWAALHLVVNGDLASLVLFGTMLVLAITGMGSIDRKRAAAAPADWARFAAVTSRMPFLAILQGRNSLKLGEIGAVRIVGGVVLWAVILHFHNWIFGMPALPG